MRDRSIIGTKLRTERDHEIIVKETEFILRYERLEMNEARGVGLEKKGNV